MFEEPEHDVSYVLSKRQPLSSSPFPGPAWVQTLAGAIRREGGGVPESWERHHGLPAGVMSPPGPSHCDSSDLTLFFYICPPASLSL